MANVIRLRRKNSAGHSALAALAVGEMEVNHVDRTILYKRDATTGWIMDFLQASQILNDANLTGTPTAPTAPAGTNNTQVATTEFVQEAVSDAGGGDMTTTTYDSNSDGKVDNADNADSLGGIPAADYATEAYADNAAQSRIDALIGGAPGALDTIAELATAFENNPDIISELTSLIGTKLDENSTIDGGTIA